MKKPAENPYLDGRRAWLEQTGDDVKAKNDYRLIAIGCFVLALVCAGGMVAIGLQHKVVPYAIEFNEHDEAVRVIRVDEMVQPNANQIKAALRNWIIGARTVYGDRRAQEHLIALTFAMTLPDSPALQTVGGFQVENNPYLRAQKESVDISVNSVMAIGGDTWRIEWTETTKKLSGHVIDSKIWQGTFKVVIVPPVDEKQILINPMGVYVQQVSWSTRL